ncbi:MAG: hypothetical protein HS117_12120 [Verrucomicrobiaceae bacterium]|jgi:hypothetical protein|nr:hypothetical protein [Verrucomicrobiaceae bacterium]
MNILQILPRVPPAVCGIADYAWGIARGLRDQHDIHSRFLSAGTSWTEPAGTPEFPVNRLAMLSTPALVELVKASTDDTQALVLHLSPYGFQKRAVPFWLASAWRQIARLPKRPRMITMFHELYATGSVRSSAFWLQPLQKQVLRVVARASDALRTNRQPYADWLLGIRGLRAPEVEVMPVYSNFGEPETLPSWQEREPSMAMFAWGIHSGESLEETVARAAACCRKFGMTGLHLLGCKQDLDDSSLGVKITRHGFLEAAAISRLLLSCRMAYTAYSPEHFGKSTLVAAFAAHGLALVTQGRTPVLPDGLREGVELLHERTLPGTVRSSELETIARSLRSWYDTHSLKANVQSYASQIKSLYA